jgi:hypothetical protein
MNSKIYNLFIKNSKSFILLLSNFAIATSFNIIIKSLFIKFVTQMSLIMNALTSVKISLKIISTVNLSTLLLTSIAKISPKLNVTTQALMAMISNIDITNPINAVLSQIGSIVTIIHTDKIKLVASPLLGQFFTLGHFDPSTLGSLDSSTLGDMDFVAT